MRYFTVGFLVSLSFLVVASASAQPPTPMATQRPTFSPYLNLLNRNFSPAGNYLGFVRPQQQMQQQFGQLQNRLYQTNQNLMSLQSQSDQLMNDLTGGLPSTANIPTFMNTGHYFSYNPALMSGGAGGRGGMSRGGMGGPMMGGGGMNQLPQPGSLPGGGQIGGANRGGGGGFGRPAMGGPAAGGLRR